MRQHLSLVALFLWLPAVHIFSIAEAYSIKMVSISSKETFLKSLDDTHGFNAPTKERTAIVMDMVSENPLDAPGSTASFTPVAVGKWRIIYAPHIYTMGKLFGGSFDPVFYIMKPNGEMTSHARYNFPIVGSGWLSVSGTYGSQDEKQACRVDFNKTWVKILSQKDAVGGGPFDSFESVPASIWKVAIQALGKLFFIDAVSVFPVTYLDEDTIIFDFELLGTRICARKLGPV